MTTSSTGKKVLLIGWDGADWRIILPLLEKGELPNLEKFIEQGSMGNLASLQPTLSPMIWTSIATGKLPDKHGILGFSEIDEDSGAVRSATNLSRKVKAIWTMLSQKGLSTHVVNWFAGHPAEPVNGVSVSPLFPLLNEKAAQRQQQLPKGTVYPEDLAGPLANMLVRPNEIDSQAIFLFVSRFKEVDQHNDHRLKVIARLLAKCFSVHAAATWIMESRPWDFMAVYFQTIDNFCHGFMQFHPPRPKWVNEKEFELYHDVINSAYRLHDLLLGRLLQLAGKDTTVIICSDHGFHIGDQRPTKMAQVLTGPTEQHRPVGILAMKGPGIKQDELIHGANILDITPTILSIFGLPVGRDMDGRPLLDAFEQDALPVTTIPSWEELEGCAGMHAPGARIEPGDSRAILEQFAELGYIEKPVGGGVAAEITRLENSWNLARVHLYSGLYHKALPLLEENYDAKPLRLDFALTLAECQFKLGLFEEACTVMKNLSAVFPRNPRSHLLFGIGEYYRGNLQTALEHLKEAEKAQPRLPALFVQLGFIYLALNKTEESIKAYRRALDIDPDTAAAHLGMARCHMKLRAYDKAANAALEAIGLEFSLAPAHFCLGKALIKLNRIERAVEAFEACLRFQPRWTAAHGYLAWIYGKILGNQEKANHAIKQIHHGVKWQAWMRQRAENIREEAAMRSRERQRRREAEARELMEAISSDDFLPADDKGASESVIPVVSPGSSGKEFILVSGLPRSGTSLMMQMLAAAGVPVMTDNKRPADDDNPQGYYEWAAVKQFGRNPHLIEEAKGKAVKVISLLLPILPPIHRYKIIFMQRPAEEVAASQVLMLKRMNGREVLKNHPRLIKLLDRHQNAIIKHLQQLSHVQSLVVNYPDLIACPDEIAWQIEEFLGPQLIIDRKAMEAVVNPQLYRQRAGHWSSYESA